MHWWKLLGKILTWDILKLKFPHSAVFYDVLLQYCTFNCEKSYEITKCIHYSATFAIMSRHRFIHSFSTLGSQQAKSNINKATVSPSFIFFFCVLFNSFSYTHYLRHFALQHAVVEAKSVIIITIHNKTVCKTCLAARSFQWLWGVIFWLFLRWLWRATELLNRFASFIESLRF